MPISVQISRVANLPAIRLASYQTYPGSLACKPPLYSSGYHPGFASAEEYDQLQAKKKDDTTALQSNLAALQELMPEASTEELINLLLGKDKSSELTSARLTLFSDIQSDPARNRIKDDSAPGGERLKTQAEIMAEADATARLALGLDPIDPATSVETSPEIPLQQPSS